MGSMRPRRPTSAFLLLVMIAAPAGMAKGQRPDAVAESLNLTREKKSLPVWSEPNLESSRMLARSARTSNKGVMLVGFPQRELGTAFVISSQHRYLATNAHVADILRHAGSMKAIKNESATEYQVKRVYYHPGLLRKPRGIDADVQPVQSQDPDDGSVYPYSPDVAVLELEPGGPELPYQFEIADPEEIDDLFAQPIGMMGFPGFNQSAWPSANENAVATFQDGVISRVMDFSLKADSPPNRLQLVQHTASSWSGFSGSPLLLPNGHVIAIHSMAQVAQDDEKKGATSTKYIPHGIRIDCLRELLVFHNLDDRVRIKVDRRLVRNDWQRPIDPGVLAIRQAEKVNAESSKLYRDKDYLAAFHRADAAIQAAPQYAPAYLSRLYALSGYRIANMAAFTKEQHIEMINREISDTRTYINLMPTSIQGYTAFINAQTNVCYVTRDVSNLPFCLQLAEKLLSFDNLTPSDRSHILVNRAWVLDRQGNSAPALADYNKAIELDPEYYVNYLVRGLFYRRNNRPDLAVPDEQKAESLRQNYR